MILVYLVTIFITVKRLYVIVNSYYTGLI